MVILRKLQPFFFFHFNLFFCFQFSGERGRGLLRTPNCEFYVLGVPEICIFFGILVISFVGDISMWYWKQEAECENWGGGVCVCQSNGYWRNVGVKMIFVFVPFFLRCPSMLSLREGRTWT